MNDKNEIKNNLQSAMMYICGANFIAGIIFIIIYSSTSNFAFLVCGIILILAAIAFIFIVKRMEKKFAPRNEIDE